MVILSSGRTLAVLVVLMACVAGPAGALEADCLWGHLAPAKRDNLLEAYHRDGPEALNHLNFTDEDMAGGVESCGLTLANSTRGGHLIGAKLVVIGSKRYFQEHQAISGAKLDAAWAGLGEEPRAKLTRFAQQATLGQPTHGDDMKPAFDLAKGMDLDLTTEADRLQLVAFIFGRALLESWDGTE